VQLVSLFTLAISLRAERPVTLPKAFAGSSPAGMPAQQPSLKNTLRSLSIIPTMLSTSVVMIIGLHVTIDG
ncbi:hypothetical protein, partial [Photobacterium sp. OFAV2-7]|uniref:hypothetical protein n=1 Tax=Photobacterium sp. OFAV2-7 TaxID=2917748 RepID=UPI001EF6A9F1